MTTDISLHTPTDSGLRARTDSTTPGEPRSAIVGELVLGIVFLAVGRKLWPLVLAHAFIDTIDFITHFFESTGG